MPVDPYSGWPVYEVTISGGDAYRATPVRVVSPSVDAFPIIFVDPAIVGAYGGAPIYVTADPAAIPVWIVGGGGGGGAGYVPTYYFLGF